MRSMYRLVTLLVVCFLLLGCAPSRDEIGEKVKVSMQETLDSDPDFREYNMNVTNVQVLKKDKNIYKGIASILYEGVQNDITVDEITVDGDNVMWEVDPREFLFIAQKEFDELFQ